MSAAPVARGHDAAPTRATCSGRAAAASRLVRLPAGRPYCSAASSAQVRFQRVYLVGPRYVCTPQNTMAELVIYVGKTPEFTGWRHISGGNNLVCSLGNLTEADLRAKPPADGHARGRGPPSLDVRRAPIRGSRPGKARGRPGARRR